MDQAGGKKDEKPLYLLGAVIDVVHPNADNLLGVVERCKELDVGAWDLRGTGGGAGGPPPPKKATTNKPEAWHRQGWAGREEGPRA